MGVHTLEYYWAIERNALNYAKTWRNLKNNIKEARGKTLHITWFHLYEIPEKANVQKEVEQPGAVDGSRECQQRGTREILWLMAMF